MAPDAHDAPGVVTIVGARWERIQLLLVLGGLDRSGPIPTTGDVVLRGPIAQGSQRLEARSVQRLADGSIEARFNVFAGPGAMPLEPGRWQLFVRGPGGSADSVDAVSAEEPLHGARREFVHTAWTVYVDPVVSDGAVAIDMAVRRTDGGDSRGLGGWARAVFRAIRVAGFRAAVAVARSVPRRGRMVVFTSDSRATLGGNLKLVHDRMVERGLDAGLSLHQVLKPSVRANRGMVDRVRLAWLLARASVVLVDDYQPIISRLEPRPDRRIIQLWHAWGAFKTVGYSRIGKPGGPSPFSRVHKNYSHAIASSEHEVPFYAEAFGLRDDQVIPTGTPRMDEFLDPARQAAGRERALAAVPEAPGRRVILYAPTFRGDSATLAHFPLEALDVRALHALAAEIDAVAVIKLHPFVPERIDIPSQVRDRIVEVSDLPVDVNDLMLIADLLVTDYSSLIFEYAALDRPMLFYAFDLEEYVSARDFYEPYAEFVPGRIVRTFDELLAAIRASDFEQDKVRPFARRHIPAEPGSATDRIIDQLVLGS